MVEQIDIVQTLLELQQPDLATPIREDMTMSCPHPYARLCICADCGLDLGSALAAMTKRAEEAEVFAKEQLAGRANDFAGGCKEVRELAAAIERAQEAERARDIQAEQAATERSAAAKLLAQLSESRANEARLMAALERIKYKAGSHTTDDRFVDARKDPGFRGIYWEADTALSSGLALEVVRTARERLGRTRSKIIEWLAGIGRAECLKPLDEAIAALDAAFPGLGRGTSDS